MFLLIITFFNIAIITLGSYSITCLHINANECAIYPTYYLVLVAPSIDCADSLSISMKLYLTPKSFNCPYTITCLTFNFGNYYYRNFVSLQPTLPSCLPPCPPLYRLRCRIKWVSHRSTILKGAGRRGKGTMVSIYQSNCIFKLSITNWNWLCK